MVQCVSGPMAAAYTAVPAPTVPPSSQPAASTMSSMALYTQRIECPLAPMAVVNPS